MTSDDAPICCMVIAPRDAKLLDDIAAKQYAQSMPYARHRHPWTTMQGTDHGALVSRSPGTEGADWTIAEIASKQLRDVPIYTLWFDDERAQVAEWRNGKQVHELDRDPASFARALGFALDEEPPAAYADTVFRNVAVVEGATLDEVEAMLAKEEDAFTAERVSIGVVVHAEGGEVFMLPFLLSQAFPEHAVYNVQRSGNDTFRVRVMRAGETVGVLQIPVSDPDDELPDILGVRTREEILAKLGVDPSLLGY